MNRSLGITVIEALVGISILGFAMVFIAHSQTTFFNASGLAMRTTHATYLAEEGQEFIRFLRDEDWTQLTALTNGTDYYFDVDAADIDITSSPEVIGEFSRKFTLSPLNRDANDDFVETGGSSDAGGRIATVTVTWGTQTVTLQAIVTNLHDV